MSGEGKKEGGEVTARMESSTSLLVVGLVRFRKVEIEVDQEVVRAVVVLFGGS